MVEKEKIYLMLDKRETVEDFKEDMQTQFRSEENIQGIVKDAVSEAYKTVYTLVKSDDKYNGYFTEVDKEKKTVTIYIVTETRRYTYHIL